jgi:hypothetical protein
MPRTSWGVFFWWSQVIADAERDAARWYAERLAAIEGRR